MRTIPSYTKAIIRKSKIRISRDGTTQVLIYYHHHNTIYFKTPIWINPKDWDKKLMLVSSKSRLENVNKMNDEILTLKYELDLLIHEFIQDTP